MPQNLKSALKDIDILNVLDGVMEAIDNGMKRNDGIPKDDCVKTEVLDKVQAPALIALNSNSSK